MQLRQSTLLLAFASLTSLAIAAACTVEETTPGPGASGGEGGEDASGGKGGAGGKGGSSGKGGTGGSTGGKGGSAGTGTGGTGGSGEGGEGGETGTVDCTDAETLPDTIDVDTTVGPGCVRIDRTTVTESATLTIEPGTTVIMAEGGFLGVATFGDNSALVSVGTESNPITFTSEALSPLEGDWQCVAIAGASSGTEIRYTTFEYGGDACDTTGAGYEGMLQLNSSARAVSNNVFRYSLTHGVLIQSEGNVREFENNSFSDNLEPSIDIAAPQLLVLGEGLEFADDDDRIEVNTTFSLASTGTWLSQPVPFRLMGGLAIGGDAQVTIDAGTTVELTGNSIDVFGANLIVAGSAAAPVTFTAAAANPIAGEWGCITFSSETGTPRFDYAVIEYAGNGTGCTGANYETALRVPASAIITNTTFRSISGSAITASDCNIDDWCANTFEDVETGPLACDTGQMPTACP
jgi:hypothetical protein